MSTAILGISAFYHDSAACLLKDGEVFAAHVLLDPRAASGYQEHMPS